MFTEKSTACSFKVICLANNFQELQTIIIGGIIFIYFSQQNIKTIDFKRNSYK